MKRMTKEFFIWLFAMWSIIASTWLIFSILNREQLRAAWAAHMEAQPSHSCVPPGSGERVVCWMEDGVARMLLMKPGDGIVSRDCLAKRDRRKCAR